MIVAAVQSDVAPTVAETLATVSSAAAAAAERGANLIVLPEMFATGYHVDPRELGIGAEGAGRFLEETATDLGVWLMGSHAALSSTPGSGDSARVRNRLTVAGPNGERFHYDKRHLFTYASEHLGYEAGGPTLSIVVDGVRITPSICYDLRFADDFWASGPETDLFVVVANWPIDRQDHWSTLLTARAVENQCYVMGVNRVGRAGDLEYQGGSCVIDPHGRLLAEVDGPWAGTALAAIDEKEVAAERARYPFLDDRR
ncbi:MAG: nitrilase-related carbon-nitrogen hydrolase [Microthrixaceae bacterium]